jgi:Spy/CpxP family protein refolding chaperone
MKMKKSYIVLTVLLAFALATAALPAFSQDAASANPDAKLQQISQQLNLTDDQKTKLKPILTEEAQQIQGVKDDTSMSPTDKKAKMHEIKASHRTQINEVLTPDQQKKWAEMRQSAHEKAQPQSQQPQ